MVKRIFKGSRATSNGTGRQSYISNEPYQESQDRIPEKTMADQYSMYPESEFQQPYRTPFEDYQMLENSWQPTPIKPPDPITDDRVPDVKETCEDLWVKLFGKWAGGTPNNLQWKLLQEYGKYCPIKYIWTKCCGVGLRVYGPTNNEINSGASFTFTMGNVPKGCTYYLSAKKGTTSGLTYTAPVVYSDTVDYISVIPFTGAEKGSPCLVFKITIKNANCAGSEDISLTSTQMTVSTSQVLTATNTDPGKSYSWVIVSGVGSLSPATGTTTTYTAPASNPNCQNPVIQLKVGPSICKQVTIAINQWTGLDSAVRDCQNLPHPSSCPDGYNSCSRWYLCNGTYSNTGYTTYCNCLGGLWADSSVPNDLSTFSCSVWGVPTGFSDVRTPEMLAAGCCPSQLL